MADPGLAPPDESPADSELALTDPLPEFSRLLQLLGHDGTGPYRLSICSKREDGGHLTPALTFPRYASSRAASAVARAEHVWFGVCGTMAKTGRGTDRDVEFVPALWLDLDFKVGGMGSEENARTLIDNLSMIGMPSAIVLTGGGLQPYWPMTGGKDVDTARRVLLMFHLLASAIARDLGGSIDKVCDLPRILRVPGSVNYKAAYGDPRPVTVEFPEDGDILDLYEVEQTLIDLLGAGTAHDAEEAASGRSSGPILSSPTEWVFADLNTSCSYIKTMFSGWASDVPTRGRHPWLGSQMVRLVAALRLGELSDKDVITARTALTARMKDLCEAGIGGDPRSVGDFEVSTWWNWAIEKVARKTERECRSELGDHQHLDGPDTGVPDLRMLAGEPLPTVHHRTDLGNALRLVELAKKRGVLWNPAMDWLVYDGRRWVMNAAHEVDLLAQAVVRQIRDEAARMKEVGVSEKEVNKHMRWATTTEGGFHIRAAKTLAQPHLFVAPEKFDAHPHLFNTLNCTVDLRTGQWHLHDKNDLITKVARASWDPRALCPTFDSTLVLFQPEEDMRTFLQRLYGYGLTGHTSETVFGINHGVGSNGKSTLTNAISRLMGDYSTVISAATLARSQRSGSSPSPDIAQLAGMRFVLAAEPNQLRLDPSFVKSATGGEEITARHLFGKQFTFKPEFLLTLATNERPVIDDASLGMWRRVLLIPWEVTISGGDIVPEHTISEAFRAEANGILRWLIEGAVAWYSSGLAVPAHVRKATSEYRSDSDVMLRFLSERGFELGEGSVAQAELTAAWNVWKKDYPDDAKPVGGPTQMVARLCSEHGVVQNRLAAGRVLEGVRKLPSDESETYLPAYLRV